MPNFAIERRCTGIVCGIDEAGRGPLAGPVVAAAVILDQQPFSELAARRSSMISKLLTRRGARGLLAGAWALRRARRRPDRHRCSECPRNRQRSTSCARHCWRWRVRSRRSGCRPDIALVDGNIAPPLACPVQTVVKGDGLSFSIAAASVAAKVTRDRIMRALARRYQGYGWETNVGYATREHGEAIARSDRPRIIAAPSRRCGSRLPANCQLFEAAVVSLLRRERRNRVTGDFFHQGRQRMLAELVDRAP